MEPTAHSPPEARSRGLVCRALADGLMVYDVERHRVHSLNQTAALIWRRCDGQTAIPELANRLQEELGIPGDEALVWLALDRLGKAHLLRERPVHPTDSSRCSRREVIRKLSRAGVAAAVVPLVASISSPAAEAAASPSAAKAQCQSACATAHASCISGCPSGRPRMACVRACNAAQDACKGKC
jgi:hypothetical protein